MPVSFIKWIEGGLCCFSVLSLPFRHNITGTIFCASTNENFQRLTYADAEGIWPEDSRRGVVPNGERAGVVIGHI